MIVRRFEIETYGRALGKHILHRAGCSQCHSPITFVGTSVSAYMPIQWANEMYPGKVLCCAYCMYDMAHDGSGWPQRKWEEPSKSYEVLGGGMVFVRVNNKNEWLPGIYKAGPHRVDPDFADSGRYQYAENSTVYFFNEKFGTDTFPPDCLINFFEGLFYKRMYAVRSGSGKLEHCIFCHFTRDNRDMIFKFHDEFYEIVKIKHLMAADYD